MEKTGREYINNLGSEETWNGEKYMEVGRNHSIVSDTSSNKNELDDEK